MSDGFYFFEPSFHTARIYHEHCLLCGWQIAPGEQYERNVFVSGGQFIVYKQHYGECPHEPFDDPEERFHDRSEERAEELPIAA